MIDDYFTKINNINKSIIKDRRKEGYKLLHSIYNNNNELILPLSTLHINLINEYANKNITKNQFIKKIPYILKIQLREIEAVEYYYGEELKTHRDMVMVDGPDFTKRKIIKIWEKQIIEYSKNEKITLNNLKNDRKYRFKKNKRENIIRQICEKIENSNEMLYLPNHYLVYFRMYFDIFINNHEITLPYLLHKLEEKHNLIMCCQTPCLMKKIQERIENNKKLVKKV